MTALRPVLLVEDCDNDAQLTLRAFRKNGVTSSVHVAADGVTALAWLADRSAGSPDERPALVILDLHMTRLDGFQVLERIRHDDQWRTLPVVILTSSREPADIARCYALGANSYVRKPIEFAEFVQLTADLCRYWLQWNEVVSTPVPAA